MDRIFFVLNLCLLCGAVRGQELSPGAIAARDFGVGRIKLGMDQTELGFQYAPALGDQQYVDRSPGDHLRFGNRPLPPDMGVVSYVVPKGTNRHLALFFQYGTMVALTAVQENVHLSAVPAIEAHQAKAIAKFGPDYSKSGRDLTWRFPSVNRKVEYRVADVSGGAQTVAVRVSFLSLNP